EWFIDATRRTGIPAPAGNAEDTDFFQYITLISRSKMFRVHSPDAGCSNYVFLLSAGYFGYSIFYFPEQDATGTFQTVRRRLPNKNNLFNGFLWISKNNLILASVHLSNGCG